MPSGENLASGLLALSSESRQLAGGGLAGLASSYSLDPHLPGCYVSPIVAPGAEVSLGLLVTHSTLVPSSHQCPWLWLPATDTATPLSPAQSPRLLMGLFPECLLGRAPPTYSTFHAPHIPALTSSPLDTWTQTPGLSHPLHLSIQPPPSAQAWALVLS